jgi:hypothetical protein
MYRSYKQCGFGPVYNLRSVGYMPHVATNKSAVPESMRMATEVCPTLFVTTTTSEIATTNSTTCITTTYNQTLSVPTIPGAPLPYVTVGTVPASVSVAAKGAAAAAAASNPYNPDTRFSQYFPPAPIPYCPPARSPNTDPRPSVNQCMPIQRFTGVTNN